MTSVRGIPSITWGTSRPASEEDRGRGAREHALRRSPTKTGSLGSWTTAGPTARSSRGRPLLRGQGSQYGHRSGVLTMRSLSRSTHRPARSSQGRVPYSGSPSPRRTRASVANLALNPARVSEPGRHDSRRNRSRPPRSRSRSSQAPTTSGSDPAQRAHGPCECRRSREHLIDLPRGGVVALKTLKRAEDGSVEWSKQADHFVDVDKAAVKDEAIRLGR